jgi:Peptidase inhibitor I9
MPRICVALVLSVISLIACNNAAAPNFDIVPPACVDPAPLRGQLDSRAPGYIVMFKDNVAARPETNRLAAAYGFTPRHIYEFALQGFSAELTPEVVAAVRCEASVQSVEHDGFVSIDG